MANSLTEHGEELMLFGDGSSDGSLARLAAKVKLYLNTSTPDKDGTGFNEVANGNGYVTDGKAITVASWTFSVVGGFGRITLDDQTWTASGSTIDNVQGAFITDSADAAMAWWERSLATTLSPGDSLTLDDLYVSAG